MIPSVRLDRPGRRASPRHCHCHCHGHRRRQHSAAAQSDEPEAPSAAPASTGDPVVEELVGLVQNNRLAELRTTYNGPYGASLLFNADDLNYYVLLFQQRQFWRATKTRDYQQAEQLYRTYMAQTEDLAEVAIDRIRLDAENIYMQARIDANSGELATLRKSLDFQRQREREVAAEQERTRQEARAGRPATAQAAGKHAGRVAVTA